MSQSPHDSSSRSSGGGGGVYGTYYYGEGYTGYAEPAVAPQRSIKDYLLILRERIWWLVITTVFVFLGTAVYTLNAPKVYRAFATIELLREKNRVFQVEDVVQQRIQSSEDLNTQLNIMESVRIVDAVKNSLQGRDRELFLAPYEDGIESAIRGEVRSVESILYHNRSVQPVRNSLMVRLVFEHPNPEVAANVANLFAREYIEFNRRNQIEGSLRAVDVLQEQVNEEQKKISEMEVALVNMLSQFEDAGVDPNREIQEQQLMNAMSQRDRAEVLYEEALTKWQQIQKARADGEALWELSFISNRGDVGSLRQRLSEQIIAVATLEKKYRDKHPKMIAARESLDQIRSELQAVTESAAASIHNEYRGALQNYDSMEERVTDIRAEINSLNRLLPEFNALSTRLANSREQYAEYYNRLQEARVNVVSEAETARVIDEAEPPGGPFKPNVALNLMIGLAAGGALGIGLVVLLALLDDKVKTAFDIETTVGIPLIGIVPRISMSDPVKKARVVSDNLDARTVESFRSIHSALKLNEESRNATVILTTSTIPSEGKSFVTTNLAFTYSGHGARTIILDGDLRMPNVAKSMGITQRPGILDYINGTGELDDLILKDFAPNLDVLVAGGRTKLPTQMLSNERFEQMLQELRMRYDKVLIDSPPLAPVSDSLNILPFVDGVIYVVRFNSVKRKTAAANVRRLLDSNTPIFGAVLNHIHLHVAGYYYSHYYDSSYTSYYHRPKDATEPVAKPA